MYLSQKPHRGVPRDINRFSANGIIKSPPGNDVICCLVGRKYGILLPSKRQLLVNYITLHTNRQQYSN